MRIAHSILACLFATAFAVSCSPNERLDAPSSRPASSPDVRDVAAHYRELLPMTKEAVIVDPTFAAACASVAPVNVDLAEQMAGPHAHMAVMVYMNAPAAAAFKQAANSYPVGSIVVKAKSPLVRQVASGTHPTSTDGVGGMIKRPAGYDTEHGDWEYFYFDDPAKIESGKIESCVQCHRGAAGTDYVFGNWGGK